MRNWLIFNGKSTKDFGVYISGLKTFDAPERDVEIISRPGRNGDLTLDNGRYKNIDISYPAFIYDRMSENVAGLRNYLLSQNGYVRLEDTYHPDEFRLARFKGPFSVKVVDWLEAGEFDLTFDCYPQRFLKEGEKPIIPFSGTLPATIFNPGMKTYPLLKLSKNAALRINDIRISCQCEPDEIVTVDCYLEEAYIGTPATPANNKITLVNGVFPWFEPGENILHDENQGWSGDEVIPRWWIL